MRRDRRIGRKVLLADRLSHALDRSSKRPSIVPSRFRSIPRKAAFGVAAGVLVLGLTGTALIHHFSTQAAAAQKVAATKEQQRLEAKSRAADACRRNKAEQKADQLGKVTYDELYDYDECDR